MHLLLFVSSLTIDQERRDTEKKKKTKEKILKKELCIDPMVQLSSYQFQM